MSRSGKSHPAPHTSSIDFARVHDLTFIEYLQASLHDCPLTMKHKNGGIIKYLFTELGWTSMQKFSHPAITLSQ